jgi:lysozyme
MTEFSIKVSNLFKKDIEQYQFDAFVSFSFNVGIGAFSKSTLLKKFRAGDIEGAAKEFARWNKGGGKVLKGLVRRRVEEAKLFLGQV